MNQHINSNVFCVSDLLVVFNSKSANAITYRGFRLTFKYSNDGLIALCLFKGSVPDSV